MDKKMSRTEACRFCFPDFAKEETGIKIFYRCTKKDSRFENEDFCIDCPHFSSRYIEYPIEISNINIENFNSDGIYKDRVGEIVKVRPCAAEYEGKTFAGILLGDLIIAPHVSHNRESKALNISAITNPAIFVPELKKIIYGNKSWWSPITNEKDLEMPEITDADISNTWYVKLFKELQNKK